MHCKYQFLHPAIFAGCSVTLVGVVCSHAESQVGDAAVGQHHVIHAEARMVHASSMYRGQQCSRTVQETQQR
jgi:hypothetical protein